MRKTRPGNGKKLSLTTGEAVLKTRTAMRAAFSSCSVLREGPLFSQVTAVRQALSGGDRAKPR